MSPNDIATWAQVASAIVQALAALAIVVLTVWLARTASGALKAARAQAEAADGAIGEMRAQRSLMRVQGLLGAVPLLHVMQPRPNWHEPYFDTGIGVSNATGLPALDVVIRIYTELQDGTVGTHEYAWHRRPMLAPGDESMTWVNSHELRNMGLTDEQITEAARRHELPPYYHSDKLVIVVQCRSMLGARVEQRYLWLANAGNQDEDYIWRPLSLDIDPDDGVPEHRIHLELGG